MRYPEDVENTRSKSFWSGRGRIVLIVVAVAVVLFLFSMRALAGFYTDFLWFDSLDMSSVWKKRLGMQVVLAIVFSVAFFAICYLNLALADRMAPKIRTVGAGDELFERFREFVEPRQLQVRVVVSAALAIAAGAGTGAQWQNWLLFRYGKSFGEEDPTLGMDMSFYMFKLPFLSYVVSWAFAAIVVVLLATAMNHYINGAVRLPANGKFSVSSSVKIHISVLMGVLALVKAADYALARYRLTLSKRGVVDGALYSEVNAELPALSLLLAISILSAALFFLNLRKRGWGLPVAAVGLWLLVSLVVGTAYPLGIQRFKVLPKESALEAEYIANNIEATRAAMGFGNIEEIDYNYSDTLTDEEVTANKSTVGNIRLLDPSVVRPTFATLEGKLDFYGFDDLDVDRYEIDGQATQVVLGARELNLGGIPRDTWEAEHLEYTNGYGVALAPANAVNSAGEPEFLLGDVPAKVEPGYESTFQIDQPQIYFGEPIADDSSKNYAIVDTNIEAVADEDLEALGDSVELESGYKGTGGVPIGSFLNQAAFALRFGDIEPLISDYLTEDSKIIFIRDITERVEALAPFLTWDSDPYPIITDGGLNYMIDGYTTSAYYPNAQSALVDDLGPESTLRSEEFNYIRNSAKAMVNAYDGSVTIYLTDELYGEQDPVIRAYAAAFPDLFTDLDQMSDEIMAHLRYPEDMFRVQTSMWGRYHLEDPRDFYNQDDRWDIAQKPPEELDKSAASTVAGSLEADRIDPYYLQMRLPEASADEFVIFRPFVPYSGPNSDSPKRQLNAFMVGQSDPENYGELKVFTMTEEEADGTVARNREVDGPLIVHQKMVSETENSTSQDLTLLNSQGGGSTIKFGDMIIVPIDNALLYVRPIYVSGESQSSPPELRKVMVYLGNEVKIGDTLAEAVMQLFPDADVETREENQPGETPTTTTPETTPPTTNPDQTDEPVDNSGEPDPNNSSPVELLDRASTLFEEADAALKDGGASGFAEYERKISEAAELVAQAESMLSES